MRSPSLSLALLGLALAGCAKPVRPEDLKAPRLVQALPRPGFVLEKADGSPYDFRAETRGTLTFLFFGYTTDPERDTPQRLRTWLAQFDTACVGVTGTPAALELALRSVGMPPAVKEGELPKGGGYGISHAAQIW